MSDSNEAKLRAMNELLEQRVAERTAEAQQRADQLRDLALALANAEAHERKRLAQRLHDGLQQLLSAARLKTAIVRRKHPNESAQEAMLQVERMLEEAIAESRALSAELSPPVLYDAGLCPAVEAFARNFQPQHNIAVKCKLDGTAEPESERVRVLLFEAIRELLNNVAQHAKATSAEVSITVGDTGQILINVCDDGQGFDPTQAQIRRGDHPFGLIEIRERLRCVGGDMEIETAPGQGTRITLRAPTELRGATRDDHPHASHRVTRTADGRPLGKAKIVVADDHALFRDGLINVLSQDPELQVVGEAADGEEAIEMVHALRPDILIVDVTMPKLNGIEVTARLSREMPHLKIVGLSMHERQDMARAMRDAGASAYVTKGGSSEALLTVLRQMFADNTAAAP